VKEFEPLIVTCDLSDDDLLLPARLSAVELLPDMIPYYAKRLEERQREPATLYRVVLPGSRTLLGEARLANLEIARQVHGMRSRRWFGGCSLRRFDRYYPGLAGR
jgi:hypothetical protein